MDILTALEHQRAGRLNEAVQLCTQLLQADPDNAEALHLLGSAACSLGDAQGGVALIARACELSPTHTGYLLSLGMAYRLAGQFDLSLACYARVLELEPGSASALFGLGNTLQSAGSLTDAAEQFRLALQRNPVFVEAHYNLANLYKSFGQLDQAIKHYRLAVMFRPGFADAQHNLGSALHAAGKLDEALASYEQALARNWPETHNNIGNIHADRGQPELALACYRQALSLRPDYPEAANNLGSLLRKLGDDDGAAAAFREALRLQPDYAVAHLNLGDLLLDGDQVDEAARHIEQAVSSSPDLARAWFSLGLARNRQREPQAAGDCFEQALARNPDDLDARYNLGAINGRLARLAEAERCYREVLARDPHYLNAHINLSAILLDDGRTAEARQHLDFAYSRHNLFDQRKPGAVRTVLILFDAGKGNLNLTHLFKDSNNILDWMIEYARPGQAEALPHYDVAFNAMGDPDVTSDPSAQVRHFLQACRRPLLNHPDKVAPTARNRLPALLAGIEGLSMPPVWRFAAPADWDASLNTQLPLLIRPVHTHGGVGMVLATSPAELTQAREAQSGPVFVSHYLDYRSADGWFRKYRIIFIDRKPYPYHLAISQHWIVHYYTADMQACDWKLDEEKQFLAQPETVLGETGMRAIEAIGVRMDLDYAGIDFSILPDGRILVFEANPTMLVHPEDKHGPLAHKNSYVSRIFDAFEVLLDRLSRIHDFTR